MSLSKHLAVNMETVNRLADERPHTMAEDEYHALRVILMEASVACHNLEDQTIWQHISTAMGKLP